MAQHVLIATEWENSWSELPHANKVHPRLRITSIGRALPAITPPACNKTFRSPLPNSPSAKTARCAPTQGGAGDALKTAHTKSIGKYCSCGGFALL